MLERDFQNLSCLIKKWDIVPLHSILSNLIAFVYQSCPCLLGALAFIHLLMRRFHRSLLMRVWLGAYLWGGAPPYHALLCWEPAFMKASLKGRRLMGMFQPINSLGFTRILRLILLGKISLFLYQVKLAQHFCEILRVPNLCWFLLLLLWFLSY